MDTFLRFAASNAVTATILAVFVALVTRFCRRPAVRHALWLLVLLKLVAPPLLPIPITWPHLESTESPAPSLDSPSSEPREPMALSVDSPSSDEAPPTDLPASADWGMTLPIIAWLGGSFVWWTIAVFRVRKFQRLLRQATPAAAEVQAQTQRLAALLGLRHCPSVAFVSAPLSPLLWALGFTPRLLLPSALWQRLDAEQRDTLLAHELAHLRRGDPWIRRLEFVVLGLYWWHPVVWWARWRLQEAEEECCDALVVSVLPEAASAYASALVATVTFLSQARTAAIVGVSGAGQVPLLKRRLTMILTENRLHRPSPAVFWLVLGLGALLLPWTPGARTETMKEGELAKEPTNRKDATPEAGMHWFELTQNCASCHLAQAVNPHDLHFKPQDWQDAHREAIKLMDQYSRLLRDTDRPTPLAESNRGDEIEKLQDEIELLRLQVRLKETRLHNAQKSEALVRRRLDRMTELARRQPGAISRDEIQKATEEVEPLAAEIEVKQVELAEAKLRLKQAERRLTRLQRPAEKAKDEHRSEQEKRLRELEQKVEGLLKELRHLRRDMQPEKPQNSATRPG